MSTKWLTVKPEYESHLQNAGITDKDFSRAYLRFARTINTIWNNREKGCSNEAIYNSHEMERAKELIENFNNNGYGEMGNAKHWNLWVQICEANGLSKEANISDWLS